MNERIHQLLAQMAVLEDDLREALHEQETSMLFEIRGKRVEFEHTIKQVHRRLKTGFFRWLVTNRPQNLITGPVIYSMIVPLLVLDLFVTLYQAVCFPIYRVVRVRRGDYIVMDRLISNISISSRNFTAATVPMPAGSSLMCLRSWPEPSSIFARSSMHAGSWAPIPATPISSIMGTPKTMKPGSRRSALPPPRSSDGLNGGAFFRDDAHAHPFPLPHDLFT
jgi:hypothetical protein